MRKIAVVTTNRADYGILLPLLRAIRSDKKLRLRLLVSGSHLSPEFGMSVRQIEDDGFPLAEKIEMLLSSDSPDGIAKSIGLGVIGFAQAYARSRPDLLVVLGDRYEMYAAALAAVPFKIPMAHIHGGEITRGAMDDALRHSLTKLSHLHFVSTENYARRVQQLGEAPENITVCGALALDNLKHFQLLSAEKLETSLGLKPDRQTLLATFHPVTLQFEQTERQITEVLKAIKKTGLPILFTQPNPDTSGRLVEERIRQFLAGYPQGRLVSNLGIHRYFSLMSIVGAMVGNSSSGILEAASFGLPVVNIGERQAGRDHGKNVLDVECKSATIFRTIQTAIDPAFRLSIRELANPYDRGGAAKHILNRLKTVKLDDSLLIKRFCDTSL